MRTFYAVLIIVGASLSGLAQQSSTGWRVLFDGKTLDAWRGYKTDKVPAGWRIADGSIVKDAPVGDIVSKDEFGDFELELEWKIGEAGNSGIFYRGTEEYDHIYWSAPEYQLLDDIKATDNKTRLTCAGAAYALYPSPAGHLKPVGQWNRTRIVAKGPHVEHWLNGVKVVDASLDAPEAMAGIRKRWSIVPAVYEMLSKQPRKDCPISLQNHGDEAWFRDIKIRR